MQHGLQPLLAQQPGLIKFLRHIALAKAYQDITPYHTNHPPALIH
jgi:hypothetical protein